MVSFSVRVKVEARNMVSLRIGLGLGLWLASRSIFSDKRSALVFAIVSL